MFLAKANKGRGVGLRDPRVRFGLDSWMGFGLCDGVQAMCELWAIWL